MSPVAGSPPQPVIPSGPTPAGFRFTARPGDVGTRARIEVRFAADGRRGIWASNRLDATAEPDGNLSYASAEPPSLPPETALRWRIRSGDDGGDRSPWSEWQDFSVTGVTPAVRPAEAGSVPDLIGTQLRADVHLPLEAAAIESYEIQIAPRAAEEEPSLWEPPLAYLEGGPVRDEAGDPVPLEVSRLDEPQTFAFETLDGCAAKQGMKVGTTKPTARIVSTSPILAYKWDLKQNGQEVRPVKETEEGISDDGLCIELDLPRVARRGAGYFVPPIKAGLGKYNIETYQDHSAHAVDINRGSFDDDEGDPVLAAAKGRVVKYVPEFGSVYLNHFNNAYRTEYSHMQVDTIPDKIKQFADSDEPVMIEALEPIGKIGRTHPTRKISPHLHHRHYKKVTQGPHKGTFKPIKTSFRGVPSPASVAKKGDFGPPYESWKTGQDFRKTRALGGYDTYDPEATVRVKVQWDDGTWSGFKKLRYVATRESTAARACLSTDCDASGLTRLVVPIDHIVEEGELDPDEYSIRYRVVDDLGRESDWAEDHSLVVTGAKPR